MPRPKGSKNKVKNKDKMAEAPAANNNQNQNKNQNKGPSLAILSFGLNIGDETTCPVCQKRFVLNEWELYRIGGIAGQTSSLIEGETGYACSWQCFLTYDMHHHSNSDGELISAKSGRKAKKAKVVIESAPKPINLVTEPKPITNNNHNSDIEIDPAEIESLLDLVKRLTDT